MITYSIMLAFTLAFSLLADHGRVLEKKRAVSSKIRMSWVCTFLAVIPLIIISSLRYDVGVDYFNYGNIFHLIREHGYRVHYELGFYWINLIIGKLTDNSQWILVVSAILTMFIIGWVVVKYSSSVTLSLFLFTTLGFYFYSMNNPRYYIALALSLLIGALAQNRKTIFALILICITALFFHKSVLIMIPIILIAKIHFNTIGYGILSLITILVSLLKEPIREVLFSIYTEYQGSQYDDGKGSIFNILFSCGMLVWSLLYYKHWYKKKDQFYFNLVWMASIFYCFYGAWIPESTRIGYYMSFSYILFIPKLISYEQRKPLRIFYKCGVIACGLAFCYLMLHTWQGPRDGYPFLPYQTVMLIPTWLIIVGMVVAAILLILISMFYFFKSKNNVMMTTGIPKIQNEEKMISVVVPVYKTEKYLDNCIKSILAQTYSNLEIILVDDGSPDACPQICDSYTNKDPRVKVIHKENGGLSDARNAGIDAASGDYITFVDSDDYIAPQMIQTLLQYAIDKEADISVCNYYKVFENGEKLYQPKTVQEKVMTNLEAMEDIFTASNLCEVITWNKLYAAHLFKDTEIRFPVGKIHEDNFTTYKLFYAAEKVVYVDIPLYYYVQRNDSIMGKAFDERRLQIMEAVEQTKAFVDEYDLPLSKQAENYEMLMYFNLLNDMILNHVKYEAIQKKICRFLLHHQEDYNKNPYVTRKHKIALILLRVHLYLPFLRLYKHME